ncbi:MAG: ClbS/DfsB family four-helix bundle protein [Thermomicrobium sp.]|nr:ClbS/DfsB family four-helix bundle protein [Thermomicrobium sp.]
MTIDLSERRAILQDIQTAWVELRNALRALTEHELTETGSWGAHSLKDMLAHIATWERLLIQRIEALEEGREPPVIEDIDAFNAEDIQRNQHSSLREVWDRFLETHDKLVALLERTPVLTRELVAADTYEHYREHLRDVLEYLKRRSPSRRLEKE